MIKKYLFVCLVAVMVAFFGRPAHAAVSNWEKAASIYPFSPTDFSSSNFQQSVRNLKAMNANTVSLIIPIFQSNCWSSDVREDWNSPTDAALASGIDFARSIGLQVDLKVQLEAQDTGGGYCAWRANINASDRASWFANYSNVLNHLGTIAQAHGATQMTVGAELITMATGNNPDNTTQWRNMIASLRNVFSGRLTYSANWGSGSFATETNQIKFWDVLDYIGISAYYELPSGTNSVADIQSQWDHWNQSNIQPLAAQYGKPVLFTEIGYQSNSGDRYQPWDSNRKYWAPYDGTEQANLFQALFQYWNNYSFMQGINIWNWDVNPNAGYPGNTDYTPQNKPAQTIISQFFAGGTPPNPTPTPPPTTANFSASAAVSPSSPTVGQPTTTTATVKNNSTGSISNTIVDLEIRDASDNKINQQFFQNQSFTAGQSQTYTMNWAPNTTGNYKVAVGVFNSDWSTNYVWNGSAAAFTVGNSTNPPPPPPPTSCTTINSGSFFGCYYNDQSLGNLVLTRTDSSINFDWGAGSPDTNISSDHFSTQWQGNFSFNAAQYDFTATADDGMRVYVDNNLVLDKWIDQPATDYPFSVNMTAGTHLIKVQYYENTGNAVAKLSWAQHSGTNPPPPPPPATNPGPLDVWWPTDGSSVSGTQPFKAMVENMDISQYNMYWQVDSGSLNLMGDSTADYPHKETLVDLSGWTWNSSNNYGLNFIAKDLAGNNLIQKLITIHVLH